MFLKFEIVSQLLIISLKLSESSKILAITLFNSNTFNPLWLQLNSLGHHITLMTTNPIKEASNLDNFRQIDLSHTINNLKFTSVKNYSEVIEEMSRKQLQDLNVQQILSNPAEVFDLLFVDMANPTMMALSYRFKCAFIGISTREIPVFIHAALGNSVEPALYADVYSPFYKMNFIERLQNLVKFITNKVYIKYHFYPKMNQLISKYLGDDIPNLEELQKNMSLLFLNKNPILLDVRAKMPNILITDGRIRNISKFKRLDQDIGNFLDNSEAIYVNVGNNLSKNIYLPLHETLSKTQDKIIWQSDANFKSNSRFFIRNSLPQTEILAHPSVKLFITNEDTSHLEDAIYSATPTIAIQFDNQENQEIRKVVEKGLGLKLDLADISGIQNVISEILNDKSFELRAAELSELTNQLTIDLNEMIWWCEMVLKYKGLNILKPDEIPWHQTLFLDIILFILCLILMIIYLYYKFIKLVIVVIKNRRYVKTAKLE